jgi:hypothetical protein
MDNFKVLFVQAKVKDQLTMLKNRTPYWSAGLSIVLENTLF